MSNNKADLFAALDQVGPDDFTNDEAARLQAIASARRLLSRLQLPVERSYEYFFAQPFIFATLQTLKDIGLWEAWFAAGGGDKSLDDLVKLAKVDIDTNLLRRLCRLMVSTDVIEEVTEDRYRPTKFSFFLGDTASLGPMQLQAGTDHWASFSNGLPTFLKKTGYREPLDPENTAYRDGNTEGLEFWARCEADPALQASFGGSMECWSRSKTPWPKFYDTRALVDGADGGGPLLVDVGGNIGNDVSRFLAEHPGVPSGSVVLQDRPDALKLATVSEKVDVMPHDFFTPQPVIGSRAYFFHAVFHDWADKEAIQILRNIAPAMRKGYSRLLICDVVLPAVGATTVQAALDVAMMALVSAQERTEGMWNSLITEAGFKVIKWWKDPRGYETLIEAELA